MSINIMEILGGPIFDRIAQFIPNPAEKQKAKLEFERALIDNVTQAAIVQAEINKAEAQHSSIFVAGWRPFIGWVCGFGFAWHVIVHPILLWIIVIFDLSIQPPTLEKQMLLEVMLGMLGFGGMRMYEKVKGVERSNIKPATKKTETDKKGFWSKIFKRNK